MQWFHPALKIDRFFEFFFSFAQDGKLNEKALPSRSPLAVSVPLFGEEVRLTSSPWVVQRTLLSVLAPVGRLLGYWVAVSLSPYGVPEEHSVRDDRRSLVASKNTGVTVGVPPPFGLFVLFLLLRRCRSSRR